jgi:hypothetical protein
MLHRQNSVEREIFERQLAVKSQKSHSWVITAIHILQRYDLASAYSLINDLPCKSNRKKTVLLHVNADWERKLNEKAAEKAALQYLDLDAFRIGQPHRIWASYKTHTTSVHKATLCAKLLVRRYNLLVGATRNRKASTACPLCRGEEETMMHFLVVCQLLNHVRSKHIDKVLNILKHSGLPSTNETCMHDILDPGRLTASKLTPTK